LASPAIPTSYYSIIVSDSRLVCLFEHLVKETKDVLLPEFDPQHGHIYPDIINSCKVTPQEAVEIINKIVSLGLGKTEYHDQVLKCPYCGSERIRVYFHCPSCNSTQLYKELLLEHIRDGVIGPFSRFKDPSGTLVCPSCGAKLDIEGRDYRTIGVWYRCLNCYKQVDMPKITYLCIACKREVTAHGLVIASVPRVLINKVAIEDFSRQHLAIRPIVNELKAAGYSVNSPGTLIGKSGTMHSFDIVGIDKSGNTLVVDVAISKEALNESVILNTFVKVLDTNPAKKLLVCIPGLIESAKKLAPLYGITVLEGTSVSEIITPLKSILSQKIVVPS
jgi:DNA-directed RNA polymerase subunit RPC12/RpoP